MAGREEYGETGVVFRRESPGFIGTRFRGIQFAILPRIHPRSLGTPASSLRGFFRKERRERGYMHRLETFTGVNR